MNQPRPMTGSSILNHSNSAEAPLRTDRLGLGRSKDVEIDKEKKSVPQGVVVACQPWIHICCAGH